MKKIFCLITMITFLSGYSYNSNEGDKKCIPVTFSCETNAAGFVCADSTSGLIIEALELDAFVCGE